MYNAITYAAKTNPIRIFNSAFVPPMLKSMRWDFQNGNILDYGCGPGETLREYILPLAKQSNSKVYGVDISSQMIHYARNSNNDHLVEYLVGSLPSNNLLPSLKFDCITSINVFHLIKDIQPVLVAFNNALKPGGQLGFTSFTASLYDLIEFLAHSDKWGKFWDSFEETGAPSWSRYGTELPEDFFKSTLAKNSGFKINHFKFFNPVLDVNADFLLDTGMSVVGIDKVPKHLYPELRQDIKKYWADSGFVQGENFKHNLEYVWGIMEKTSDPL